MSDPKDKDPQRPLDAPPAAPEESKRSGRVSFDERGNSVWEWQLETGVYSRDINTQKLRKLDLDELSIADTARHERPKGLRSPRTQAPLPGGGFNPYDNSSPAGGDDNPYDNARNTAKPLQPATPTPAPARKPADMRKLNEWMKLRKRIADDEDEDPPG